jgi:glycosyltransferase involved in cell wall biosynthesis
MRSVCMLLQNAYDSDARVRRKAEALVGAGYSVDVLALRDSDTHETAYVLNGVNVYTVSLGKKRASLARYAFEYVAFFLWAFSQVSLRMWRRRYVVIDVNTLPDFLVFAPALARLMGATLVLDMHEITPEFYMSKYGVPRSSRIIRLLTHLERISVRFADRVITIAEPIQDLLVSRGLCRATSTVVMNTADESRFVAAPSPASTVEFPKAHGAFLLMYHGTLTRIYGLDLAVEAFALAHAEMPNAAMWIVGGGPEAEPLKALIERLGLDRQVSVVGPVPPAEIPGWLAKCDTGVLPIRQDVFLDFAFPNKLAEYVVLGKPVIIPRLKTIQHYFSEASLAYCQPNSPEDLGRQMVRLYRDRALRHRLATRARAEYAPIRWDVMRRRYLSVVDDVVRQRTPVGTRDERAETLLSR